MPSLVWVPPAGIASDAGPATALLTKLRQPTESLLDVIMNSASPPVPLTFTVRPRSSLVVVTQALLRIPYGRSRQLEPPFAEGKASEAEDADAGGLLCRNSRLDSICVDEDRAPLIEAIQTDQVGWYAEILWLEKKLIGPLRPHKEDRLRKALAKTEAGCEALEMAVGSRAALKVRGCVEAQQECPWGECGRTVQASLPHAPKSPIMGKLFGLRFG
jgi:hypothetical protein